MSQRTLYHAGRLRDYEIARPSEPDSCSQTRRLRVPYDSANQGVTIPLYRTVELILKIGSSSPAMTMRITSAHHQQHDRARADARTVPVDDWYASPAASAMLRSTFSSWLLSSPTEIISITSRGMNLHAPRERNLVACRHLLGRLVDRVGKDAVTRRVLGDAQGVQDRDAVAQQRPQDAREARQGEVEVDLADDRQTQPPRIDNGAPLGEADQRRKAKPRAIRAGRIQMMCVCMPRLTPSRPCVSTGRSPLSSSFLKIGSKRGTAKMMSRLSTATQVSAQKDGVRQGDHLRLEVFLVFGEGGDAARARLRGSRPPARRGPC